MTDDIERNVYHEAGHAVLAVMYRLGIRKVTIKRRGNAGGWTYLKRRKWTHSDMFTMIILRCAGRAAEIVHYGESLESRDVGLGMLDWLQARALCEEYLSLGGMLEPDEEAVTNHLDELERLALDQIKRSWPAIEAVAQALQERQTLTGEEVTGLVYAALQAGQG